MRQVLALIPARGGSKGIPRKNLLRVAGLPLIAYSIRHALAARNVTRVIVSTDDAEIADVARRFGAEVPFRRPAELAQDLSTDLETFRHALGYLREQECYQPDLVVHLRPTSPVRRVAVVEECVERLWAQPEFDSLKSLSKIPATPYKMWHIDGAGLRPALTHPTLREAHSMPRQLLPETYRGNAYIDIIRPTTIFEQGSMVGRAILPYVMDEPAFDLDYPADVPPVEVALRSAMAAQTGARVGATMTLS